MQFTHIMIRGIFVLFLALAVGCGDDAKHRSSRSGSGAVLASESSQAAFALVSPANGSSGVSTAPTLRWTAAVGEDGYVVEVASDPAFTDIVFTQEGLPPGTTQYVLPLGGLSTGTNYCWRVSAVRGVDREVPSNAPFSFIPRAWTKCYGGLNHDLFGGIDEAADDGYVVVDRTASFGAGGNDAWVLRLQATGQVAWENAYGGIGTDQAQAVCRTPDGGFLVVGYTNSFGVGGYDFWLLRLTSSGSVTWQKTYGGTGHDYAQAVALTDDGGFLVGGYTASFGAGLSDYWVLKLRANGSLQWQGTFGGSDNDYLYGVCTTQDGGYVLVGRTVSFGAGSSDGWVVKLDPVGAVQWEKTFGGAGSESLRVVLEADDGTLALAGSTDSYGAGMSDLWMIRAESDGTIQWQRTYGGTNADSCFGMVNAGDGGYVLVGQTASFGAGLNDAWLVRITPVGAIVWQRAFGGPQNDYAYGLYRNRAGEFAAVGKTQSFGAGATDAWVLKVDPAGTIPAFGVATTGTSEVPFVIPQDTAAVVGFTEALPADTDITPTDTSSTVGDLSP